MKLKDRLNSPEGGWTFYWRDPNGVVRHIVSDGIDGLARAALAVFHNNNITEFSLEDLKLAIEHQICLRQSEPERSCWTSGIGDDLHHKLVKPFLRKAAQVIRQAAPVIPGAAAVAQAVEDKASCAPCGGTKVFDPKVNNLGRAGTLNRLTQ